MGINNFEMISSSSELSKKNFDNYSSLFNINDLYKYASEEEKNHI